MTTPTHEDSLTHSPLDSQTETGLMLYLRLDDVNDQGAASSAPDHSKTFFDSGEFKHAIITDTSSHSAILKTDNEFSYAAYFNGEAGALHLPSTQNLKIDTHSFTIECWFKIAPSLANLPASTTQDLPIINTGSSPALHITLKKEVTDAGFYPYVKSSNNNALTPPKAAPLAADEWHHLALVYHHQQRSYTLYLRGQVVGSIHGQSSFSGREKLQVAQAGSDFFHGYLSHIRVYNTAISEQDIEHDMYLDLPPYAFHKLYPVDFSFYDHDKQAALFIENRPSGRTYILEITNTAKETIYLRSLQTDINRTGGHNISNGPVNAEEYHFALHFDPGTLTPTCLDPTSANPVSLVGQNSNYWQVTASHATDKPDNQGDTLYFGWAPQTNVTPKIIAPGEKITLQLSNIGIAGNQGARSTGLVLLTNNIYYHHESESNIHITRKKNLNILNHRGQEFVPLHVGIVGSDTLLNNGETNTLELRISNESNEESIRFQSADPASGEEPSEIHIAFDIDPNDNTLEEWALCDPDEALAIDIPNPPGWELLAKTAGLWTLKPAGKDFTLAPKEYFSLVLLNIRSIHPSGLTHLVFSYQNLPNYWDGEKKIPLHKQPLVMREHKVGIGTSHPSANLDVDGNIKTQNLRVNSIQGYEGAFTFEQELASANERPIAIAMEREWAVISTAKNTYLYQQQADGTWAQQYIAPAQSATVAISGHWLILGFPHENDNAGGVYFFNLMRPAQWQAPQRVAPKQALTGAQFGISVAIHGNTAIIGAGNQKVGTRIRAGAAYVYQLDNHHQWQEIQEIHNPEHTSNTLESHFGLSVALNWDWLIVGEPAYNDNQGAVWLFSRHNIEASRLLAPDTPVDNNGSRFGYTTATDQHWLAVGASHNDGNPGEGRVYLYDLRNPNQWSNPQIIAAQSPQKHSGFGRYIAISQNKMLVGNTADTGQHELFIYQNGLWQFTQSLNAASSSYALNGAVAICGESLIIGASNRAQLFSVQSKASIKLDAVTGNIQLRPTVDDIGINTPPLAPLSIAGSNGKKTTPDSAMHINNDCILFGGANANCEFSSGQISVGSFNLPSLNIVGMGTDASARKVNMWAEDGFTLTGKMGINTAAHAPLSIGNQGKKSDPDGAMHISNDSILFGGSNNGKDTNSAQISVDDHSLNIKGMGDTFFTQKVKVFAAGGLTLFGNTGINTFAKAPLSIGGNNGKKFSPDIDMHLNNDCILFGGPNNGKETSSGQISVGTFNTDALNIVGMGTAPITRKVYVFAEGGLTLSGSLGIGTRPSNVPLHVAGAGSVTQTSWGDYVTAWHHEDGWYNGALNISILADDAIGAKEFRTYSDKRIKSIKSDSDSQADLALINLLRVKNYQYIDTRQRGIAIKKGLIAQEVEQLYPGAVTHIPDFIPDIYCTSASATFQADEQSLTVYLARPHTLQTGDEVRLIGKHGPRQKEVTSTPSECVFTVSHWDNEDTHDNQQVFVYGKKVADVKTVDYQEISVLAISALQALHAENAQLKDTLSTLTRAVNHLQQRLEKLEQQKQPCEDTPS